MVAAGADGDGRGGGVAGRDEVERALHRAEAARAVERHADRGAVAGAAATVVKRHVVVSVIENAPPFAVIAPLSTVT